MNNNHNQEPPPQNGPPPMVRPNGQAPRTMEELCQPSINGRGGPIGPIPIQATDFGLRHHMIQQVQNTHGFASKQYRPNPREDLKVITTWSSVTLAGPSVSPSSSSKKVDQEPETITDQVLTVSTNNVPLLVVQPSPASTSFSTISSSKMPEVPKNTVQPSTKNIQPSVAQTQVLIEPVVAQKPKPTIPYPSRVNKQKLHEKDDNLALKFVEIFRNLHFELSFVDALLHMPKFALMFKSLFNNKEKLFDLATTPVNENCSAVILNKLPREIKRPRQLSLLELTSTQMILELADRSTTRPAGIAEDVFVKVEKFHFSIDFVVVDYVVDPCVPLILERPFLRIGRALIDVYGEELTLRVDDEAITFKEYVQEVLGFSDNSKSGNPTLISDFIIAFSSPSLTPFEGELNVEKNKTIKSSIDEPPKLELKELPSHLEYAFLEGTDRLPVIISKELKDEEKSALLKVLKSHKRAIVWIISDIKGIDPRFCTHKILMEDDFKPTVQHQRMVNPKIHKVIKKEFIKLIDAGLIYPIF
uniref:Reverse transcriptase domain-containing protein n=1 Tax=Tanacetum cinerariifolium TaxID=118510 RepID=A0A699HIB1_TANCI|nr:hypothetical protein [Tanacetum cinerariifolium]